MLGFLTQRSVPGVETVAGGRYRRTTATGTVCVSFDAVRQALVVGTTADETDTLGRVRHMFDPEGIGWPAARDHLAADGLLAPLLARRPGLRIPAGWDGFEQAVRAVLGQQVSIASARALAGRLAAICGARSGDAGLPLRFPAAAEVAGADLAALGMPGARRRTLGALARAALDDPALLRPPLTPGHEARLRAVPGIGPWSAQYILLRALRDPDAFPASDVGLLRAAAVAGVRPSPDALARRAEAWRPWRAHAAQHLWMTDSAAPCEG